MASIHVQIFEVSHEQAVRGEKVAQRFLESVSRVMEQTLKPDISARRSGLFLASFDSRVALSGFLG